MTLLCFDLFYEMVAFILSILHCGNHSQNDHTHISIRWIRERTCHHSILQLTRIMFVLGIISSQKHPLFSPIPSTSNMVIADSLGTEVTRWGVVNEYEHS